MISEYRILILLDPSFRNNILPLIDSEAEQQHKTRADIIRDVLYSRYHYQPKVRSSEQLAHDANVEQQYNIKGYSANTIATNPALWVCVDGQFFDMFMLDIVARSPDDDDEAMERQYWQTSRQILQQHFFRESALACEAL